MEIIKDDAGLIDMDTTAKYLSIKKSTLYSMVMKRQIPVVKIGKLNRFRKSDLDDYINSNIKEKIENEYRYNS